MTEHAGHKAHALSLHFFSILERVASNGANLRSAIRELRWLLAHFELDAHLDVQEDGDKRVRISPKTEFGNFMRLELYSRCEHSPCPANECPHVLSSFCQWSGPLKD
jgi:hypothetical protein